MVQCHNLQPVNYGTTSLKEASGNHINTETFASAPNYITLDVVKKLEPIGSALQYKIAAAFLTSCNLFFSSSSVGIIVQVRYVLLPTSLPIKTSYPLILKKKCVLRIQFLIMEKEKSSDGVRTVVLRSKRACFEYFIIEHIKPFGRFR